VDFWLGVGIGALLAAGLAARRVLGLTNGLDEAKREIVGLRRLIGYKDGEIRALLRTAGR